uniref:EB domain-containing protein n=1 Tax=Steinernema glaseri TaxID=37863 RepID=A0A1I7YCF9_9BILA
MAGTVARTLLFVAFLRKGPIEPYNVFGITFRISGLSRDTSCHNKVPLGGHCFVQEQCPPNSGCYRGRCSCRCSFQQKNDKCVPLPPPPTTPAPPPLLPQGIPQGSDLIKLFGNFFGGGQSRGSPFAG